MSRTLPQQTLTTFRHMHQTRKRGRMPTCPQEAFRACTNTSRSRRSHACPQATSRVCSKASGAHAPRAGLPSGNF